MAIQHTEYRNTPFHRPPTITELLDQTRQRIQVSDEELTEARRRRDLLAAALRDEFPGSETYVNGSVAHGDALDPLTDIDLGIIVAEARDTHGPGKKGCADLQERAANAIRRALGEEFPDLRVEWRNRKRSILVRFRKAVSFGADDFTADVIVAIDNPNADGLLIPRHAGWSRSHPQKHTTMVKAANKDSRYTYARTVRLLKHWNRKNQKPLCSWNIKALALDPLTTPTPLAAGMVAWFDHAIADLRDSLTEDPAGVAEHPISINEDMTRTEVVDRLERARDKLVAAIDLEKAGYPMQAHEQLAKFFNDTEVLPHPDAGALGVEVARKYREDRAARLKSINTSAGTAAGAAAVSGTPAAAANPVVGHHPGHHTPGTRSWGTR